MKDEMALADLGRPDDINRTVTATVVSEQWVYRGGDLLLYFKNGVLTAWQD